MANVTAPYNEIFYVQNALQYFTKALRMANRVNRQLGDGERVGDQIKLRRPGSFTAQNAPSTAQGLNPTNQYLTFDQYKEVKIEVPDNERALTANQLITDHIAPMAYALAENVDSNLMGLYKKVPWFTQFASTFDLADVANARKILFDNLAPMNDPANMHFVMNSFTELKALKQLGFAQLYGAGIDGARQNGVLPPLFGFNMAATQNTVSHTTTTAADVTGALTANAAKNATAISFDSITVSAVIADGDTFSIAGDAQKYAFVGAPTVSGGGAVTAATIFPQLKQAASIGAVITIDKQNAAKGVNMAFHRDFAYLGFAKLPMDGNGAGAVQATAFDPYTGLSLRYTRWYDGDARKMMMAYDILYGSQVMNDNLACRMYDF